MKTDTAFEALRRNQLFKMEELWIKLDDLVALPLNLHFMFSTRRKASLQVLKSKLSGIQLYVSSRGLIWKTYFIYGSSGSILWTEDSFFHWIDDLIDIGQKSGCKFEGCSTSPYRNF